MYKIRQLLFLCLVRKGLEKNQNNPMESVDTYGYSSVTRAAKIFLTKGLQLFQLVLN